MDEMVNIYIWIFDMSVQNYKKYFKYSKKICVFKKNLVTLRAEFDKYLILDI